MLVLLDVAESTAFRQCIVQSLNLSAQTAPRERCCKKNLQQPTTMLFRSGCRLRFGRELESLQHIRAIPQFCAPPAVLHGLRWVKQCHATALIRCTHTAARVLTNNGSLSFLPNKSKLSQLTSICARGQLQNCRERERETINLEHQQHTITHAQTRLAHWTHGFGRKRPRLHPASRIKHTLREAFAGHSVK